MRSPSKLRAGVLALGVFMLPILAGVLPHPADAAGLEKVVFASTAGGAVGFLTDIIKQQKFDEKNGLNLEVLLSDPAKAEELLYYKRADAGIFAPTSAVRVNIKQNAPLRIFGPLLWNHTSVLVKPDAPYKGLDDLKGKKLGSLERISGLYTSLAVIMRMRGVDLDSTYRLIIGSAPALIAFLGRGDTDAIVHFEPIVSKMLTNRSARELVRVNDLWRELTGEPMLMIGLAAYKEWIEANPLRARRLAQTMADGISYIRARPEEAIRQGQKALNIASEAEIATLKERLPSIYPAAWNASMVANAKKIIQKNVELGLLERPPSEEVFIVLQ